MSQLEKNVNLKVQRQKLGTIGVLRGTCLTEDILF